MADIPQTVQEVDPDFLLFDLVRAAMAGDAEAFAEDAAEMAAWLDQGGAPPSAWPEEA